jgi:hypothetical protein
MSHPDPAISAQQIKLKVIRLLAEKAELLKLVEALSARNELLKTEVQEQKNTIQTLQTQNKMVKLAEMLPSDADEKQELKKMLQAYIRQVDDCIRLLSE